MRRGSKSQMYLHKILHIITTVPPLTATTSSPETKESYAEKNEISDESKGYSLELNAGVSISAPEMEESFSGLSSCRTTIGVSVGPAVIDGGAFKVNRENYRNEEAEKSLTLLIEAAKLVFGQVEEDNTKKEEVAAAEPGERRLRRRSAWLEEVAPSSTVVRTKRGRTQVLPHKYRDSVLEPSTRFPRTGPYINPTNRRQR